MPFHSQKGLSRLHHDPKFRTEYQSKVGSLNFGSNQTSTASNLWDSWISTLPGVKTLVSQRPGGYLHLLVDLFPNMACGGAWGGPQVTLVMDFNFASILSAGTLSSRDTTSSRRSQIQLRIANFKLLTFPLSYSQHPHLTTSLLPSTLLLWTDAFYHLHDSPITTNFFLSSQGWACQAGSYTLRNGYTQERRLSGRGHLRIAYRSCCYDCNA